jgi:hypothetical protein
MIERDETDAEWPAAEVDPINMAICPLIEHILAVTADGSSERKAALSEVLHIAERIKQARGAAPAQANHSGTAPAMADVMVACRRQRALLAVLPPQERAARTIEAGMAVLGRKECVRMPRKTAHRSGCPRCR